MGIFSKNHVPDPNVKRNTFDLSHQNNLTMQIGKLYPCFCQEVLPGDTFKIDTAFGLRFMPLVFPIQTKMRADVHYFYVRNRKLWKEWTNFIGDNTNEDVMPYLSPRRALDMVKTGSLGDYMGLPTTILGSENKIIDSQFAFPNQSLKFPSGFFNNTNDGSLGQLDQFAVDRTNTSFQLQFGAAPLNLGDIEFLKGNYLTFYIEVDETQYSGVTSQDKVDPENPSHFGYKDLVYFIQNESDSTSPYTYFARGEIVDYKNNLLQVRFKVLKDFHYTNTLMTLYAVVPNLDRPNGLVRQGAVDVPSFSYGDTASVIDATTLASVPFKINALPFRAYESIYNSFYRDQRNNPYLVNGENKPNVYLPTTDGGVDDNEYKLYNRNWEQDFLTSALPSPQMGAAPLVGMSSTGVASFQSEDGTIYHVKMKTADDGDTIVSAEYNSNLPNDVARSIVNIASSGISINDFRAVNSLQRWLEANFRKGLKYKDQLAAHFGVNASYAELDMPEFIGGCSNSVDIQQINQTSEGVVDPLGSYAGQASCVGGSNNTIQHYCDEHGYIIGIISIVPVPCYSQLLPKHFTKFDTLDYYFPEFGHIGLQPIPYREVCPLQASKLGVDLNSTFGYQRAWYDYLAAVDEVHGDFRTTLKDFVYNRVFSQLPSLNPDFLTVSEDDLINPFTVNEGDHVLGQVHFQVFAKRPIPRYGVPRLE